MKKIFTLILVSAALLMSMPAQAQLKFGVKGGLNLAKMDFDKSDVDTKNFTGFFIGPMAELTLPVVGLGIDGALLFSQKGWKGYGQEVIGGDGIVQVEESHKQNLIEIPINLKYNIGLSSLAAIYIAAGPAFSFNLSGDDKISGVGDIERKNAELAINLGAGVKLLGHLQVGVNYNMGMTKSAELKAGDIVNGSSYKTKTWQISLAYLF